MDGYPQLRIFLYSPAYLMLEVMRSSFPANPRIKAFDAYPLARPPHSLSPAPMPGLENVWLPLILTLAPLALLVYMRRGPK